MLLLLLHKCVFPKWTTDRPHLEVTEACSDPRLIQISDALQAD